MTRRHDHDQHINGGNAPSGVDTDDKRSIDGTKLTDGPLDVKGLNLSQTAEQSPCMKMKHVEVLGKPMDMRLSE